MKTRKTRSTLCVSLAFVCALTLTSWAEERPKKKSDAASISVMDSTEAQWGRRSINDSIYRGYTVNAVYLERGRQRLPDSFHMYKPSPISEKNVIRSGQGEPTTIRVNGVEQTLPEE